MGAAGAAVAAFTASGSKDPEEERKNLIEKRRLDYQLRLKMLQIAAQSNDPKLLQNTIEGVLSLQHHELDEQSREELEAMKYEIRRTLNLYHKKHSTVLLDNTTVTEKTIEVIPT
jgi:hypothetical protein